LKKSFKSSERPAPRNPLALDSLHLLDVIVRNGSFAQAARALGCVPSAVTYAVRRLEGDLDVVLFDRSGHRARLTPAGEEMLSEGRHLLNAAEDLVRRVKRVAMGWDQEIRIALDGAIAFERLTPLIERFYEAAPTQVRVLRELLGGTWDALSSGRADLAIGAPRGGPEATRHGTSYRTIELGRLQFVFAIAPLHPLASVPTPIPLSELRRYRQIVVADTSRELAPRTAGLFGAPDVLVVPDMAAKLTAQAAGLGVGHLPEPLAREAVARGELVVRKTARAPEDEPVNDVCIAWRTDARSKALEWWIEELRKPAQRAALLK